MVLLLAVIAVILATVLTLGWWISVLERLDVLSAAVLLLTAAAALVLIRHRRGAGWTIARGVLVGLAIAIAVVALVFSACVASQCVG